MKQQENQAEETAVNEAAETAEAAAAQCAEEAATPQEPEAAQTEEVSELELLKRDYEKEHDAYLRLAADYDNFRKRSQKERDGLYTDAKAETIGKFLPVYDNLARALEQETSDNAYKKGVEMTFNQLCEVFKKLGVEEIEAIGQTFDPQYHNAVMHVEDEAFGENTVAEVFQAGFQLGEKVIRFAMVKVAN